MDCAKANATMAAIEINRMIGICIDRDAIKPRFGIPLLAAFRGPLLRSWHKTKPRYVILSHNVSVQLNHFLSDVQSPR